MAESSDASPWHRWRGGDCPIRLEQAFQVQYENGDLSAWDRGSDFNTQRYIWNTVEPNLRITAYRVKDVGSATLSERTK